jgi:NSS family neurotransmitter:Na+ symporter
MAYYLNPDWMQLLKPETWKWAFGQVFFSMSLAFGVMITYASFLHRKSDINNNAAIIGLGDLATSFVAGIAVFSTLGAMSVASSVPVESVVDGGPDLSFIAFPYSLAQLPHSAWFSLAFFFALITLGIDSAFSITESVLASLIDKTGWNRTATLWGLSFVGFGLGLVYCSRGGMSWLGSMDGFVNGPWGIALLGLLECVVLGWAFRLPRLREHANERSDWKLGPWWDWNIRIVVPVVLTVLFAWDLNAKISNPNFFTTAGGDPQYLNITSVCLACLAPLLAIILSLFRTRATGGVAEGQPALLKPETDASGKARLSAVLAAGAILLSILAGVSVISTGYHSWTTNQAGDTIQTYERARFLVHAVPLAGTIAAMAVATGLGLVATGIAARRLARVEARGQRPTAATCFAGMFGTISIGLSLGLALSLIVLVGKLAQDGASHSETLSATGYIVLAVMLGILVFGLAWCFIRAIKAAGADEEPQLSEE